MDVVGRRLVYFNVETARRFSPVSAAPPAAQKRDTIVAVNSMRDATAVFNGSISRF